MAMQLIPAIDLLDGQCVRLHKGNFDDCKVYDLDPAALAQHYAAAGARWLHVVDLAASRDGRKANNLPLYRLLGKARQKVQTGGGVREKKDVARRLDNGADRVVIGSLSVSEPDRFARWLKYFGSDRLVAALDFQLDESGVPWPRIHGWTEGGEYTLWELLDRLGDHGLKHVLSTDIARDGVMRGPNVDLYSDMAARYPQLEFQASGGVSSLADLERLKGTGVAGAITGKALLEQSFTIEQALEAVA